MKSIHLIGSSIILISSLLLPGCSEGFQPEELITAHNRSAWNSYDIIRFDMVLSSNGETRLEASFWLDPVLSRARMQTTEGSIVVFDGSDFYSAGPELRRARFHVLTWPYFLAVPYKLDDPGTMQESIEPTLMDGKKYPGIRLTFESGVGDTPDDWYIVYQDPDSHRLHGLAYIVTYGKDIQKAETDPHAIVYRDYQEFSGIPIATHWTFHSWNDPDSLKANTDTPESRTDKNPPVIPTERLMEAHLSNFAFYSNGKASTRNEATLPVPLDELFVAPANARIEARPE